MKFQYKALVAALALSTASLSAQAAMDLGSTGNGSFVLSIWNADIGSATFDLGFNYNSFASLVNQGSFDIATGSYADAWTFISGSSSKPTYWAVFAGDSQGTARTAGAYGYYTTANSTDGMSQIASAGAVSTVVNKMDTYISANNIISSGNHGSETNGASTATLTETAGAGSANAYGTGKPGSAGPIARAEIGQSIEMLHVLSQGTKAPTAEFVANAAGTNYTFKLSSAGLLTVGAVTAVPEADSYAMLLAGLGVIGLVARRRKA